MRVALDVRWLRPRPFYGIARAVTGLVPHIVQAPDHEFLLLYAEEETRDMLEPLLVPSAARWERLPYPILSTADARRLPHALRRLEIDVYYTFNYPTSPLHRGYRVAGIVHDVIPLRSRDAVVSQRLAWRLFFGSRHVTAALLRRFHRIQVPSRHTARDLSELAPATRQKIRVVPWAADVQPGARAAPAGLDGFAPGYVLYVGRFEPYKNVAALVEAHRGLPGPLREQHPLVLVGDASEEIRDRAGSDPLVHLAGPVDDVDAAYRGAAVFAYPSLYEGYGLPPLEAMARGVPVITTARTSIPEVVGTAARLTDGSPAQLADALADVLEDEALRARLARAGLERAKEFSWERAARTVLDEVIR